MTLSLEERVTKIEQRNIKVETEKEWETSLMRKVLLVFFTYLAIGLYMYSMHIPSPWLNAVVPSIGFLLSTLTLPWFKQIWIKWKNR